MRNAEVYHAIVLSWIEETHLQYRRGSFDNDIKLQPLYKTQQKFWCATSSQHHSIYRRAQRAYTEAGSADTGFEPETTQHVADGDASKKMETYCCVVSGSKPVSALPASV